MIEILQPAVVASWELPVREAIMLVKGILNNNTLPKADMIVRTDESFLARALVELGLFPSTSQVKKNKPRLFRKVIDGETVKVGRLNLTFVLASVH